MSMCYVEKETMMLRISSFSNVVVTNMMILAPHDSPNTDGIDPGKLCIYSLSVAETCMTIQTTTATLKFLVHARRF